MFTHNFCFKSSLCCYKMKGNMCDVKKKGNIMEKIIMTDT